MQNSVSQKKREENTYSNQARHTGDRKRDHRCNKKKIKHIEECRKGFEITTGAATKIEKGERCYALGVT